MKLKNIVAGALLGVASMAPLKGQTQDAVQQDSAKFNVGFYTVEAGMTSRGNLRNRMILNPSVNYKGMNIAYLGLNEITNFDPKTYCGRNRIVIGKTDAKTKALVDVVTTGTGYVDAKVGVTNTSLQEKLGGYGFTNVETNTKGASTLLFYGKPIGKNFSIEGLYVLNVPYNGSKPFQFAEVQANAQLGKYVSAFVRAESVNFDDLTVMGGLAIRK